MHMHKQSIGAHENVLVPRSRHSNKTHTGTEAASLPCTVTLSLMSLESQIRAPAGPVTTPPLPGGPTSHAISQRGRPPPLRSSPTPSRRLITCTCSLCRMRFSVVARDHALDAHAHILIYCSEQRGMPSRGTCLWGTSGGLCPFLPELRPPHFHPVFNIPTALR